jgi:hypothetical protein
VLVYEVDIGFDVVRPVSNINWWFSVHKYGVVVLPHSETIVFGMSTLQKPTPVPPVALNLIIFCVMFVWMFEIVELLIIDTCSVRKPSHTSKMLIGAISGYLSMLLVEGGLMLKCHDY